MAQPLTDAINALTRYANETTGQSDQTLSDAVETLVEGYGQGGGDHWVRPEGWANFDLLSKDDHAVYMTIDNRCPPTHFEVYAYKQFYFQRVRINGDGSVDVLESLESGASGGSIAVDIQADAGEYPCYRVKAVSAELVEFGLTSNNFQFQKLLERWFNLPYCTNFNIGYAYRDFRNSNVVAETFVGFPQNNKPVNFQASYSLRSLRNLSEVPLRYLSLNNNHRLSDLEGEFEFSSTTTTYSHASCIVLKKIDISTGVANFTTLFAAFQDCGSLESITLPNFNSTLTSMGSMCRNCYSLKSFKFPDGDYSAVTEIANIFQECYALAEPIIFPKSLTCQIGQSAFANCMHLPCVVIPAETMLTLANVNAFTNLYTRGRHFRVYVRQALIAEYQQATNWATIYATDEDFFQPIEGSEFEYLLEGE